MKAYEAKDIRNIALVGHNSVGKTLLTDSIAFYLGATTRLGSVDDGTTISDYTSEEIEKKYSIRSSVVSMEADNVKINIVDCPGYADFIGETYSAIGACETALIVVSASSTQGTEVGTENAVEISQKLNKPAAFFINKCDYETADFDKVIESLKTSFSGAVNELQFPVGKGENFEGVVDILEMKMFTTEGGKPVAKDIPASVKDRAESLREALYENVAGTDEELMEKYLEEGELTTEEFSKGFITAFKNNEIIPVFCGSAIKQIGIPTLVSNFKNLFLSPADLDATIIEKGEEKTISVDPTKPLISYVFKTTSEAHVGELYYFKVVQGKATSGLDAVNGDNTEKLGAMNTVFGKNRTETTEINAGDIGAVVKLKNTKTNDTLCAKGTSVKVKTVEFPSSLVWEAIRTKDKKDEARIGQALHAISNEDPTFVAKFNPELRQTIIEGQGVKHIETVIKKLKDRYGIDIDIEKPKIPYRETITKSVEGSYRHKKQSGGKGQFAEVHFRMRPKERGEGFNFVDAITQGSIPARFIPAVEKGIHETLPNGVISGSQVIDLEVELFFGKFHEVDSSEMAFKIASWTCFKNLFKEAKPILLEPVYEVKVMCPEEYTGDVMGDISSKRGRPEGMENKAGKQVITAKVPLSELYGYATTLRSMTQGKASFTIEYSHYDVVPFEVQEKIMAEYEASRGQEEE
ncbi:MAG: elongation factor G [Candidatus Delongbacteria bacterium]|nr:elongation factor G [Candidatus Delongbacteria bacterium]MBN2835999.1 elongation factor G [Candidatus Delongbacteria bacterium]